MQEGWEEVEEGQNTSLKNLMFTYQHKMNNLWSSSQNPLQNSKIFNKSLPTQPIEPCPEKSGQFFSYFTKTIEEICLEFNTDFKEPDIWHRLLPSVNSDSFCCDFSDYPGMHCCTSKASTCLSDFIPTCFFKADGDERQFQSGFCTLLSMGTAMVNFFSNNQLFVLVYTVLLFQSLF